MEKVNQLFVWINANKGQIATFITLFVAGYAGAMALNTQFMQAPLRSLPPDKAKPADDNQVEFKDKAKQNAEIIESLVPIEKQLTPYSGVNLASKYSGILSTAKKAPTNQFIESLKKDG